MSEVPEPKRNNDVVQKKKGLMGCFEFFLSSVEDLFLCTPLKIIGNTQKEDVSTPLNGICHNSEIPPLLDTALQCHR